MHSYFETDVAFRIELVKLGFGQVTGVIGNKIISAARNFVGNGVASVLDFVFYNLGIVRV